MPPIPALPLLCRLGQDLLSGASLLTRAPLPDHRHSGAASAWSWPVIGLVIGAVAAAVILAGGWLGIAPGPLSAMALAAMAMLSGGLHEDGLADSADGLFGARSRERRLEIMKDSHIGSFGVLALLLVTLAAWSALSGLIASGRAPLVVMAAAALSRAPMAVLMAALPPARANGLSAASGRPSAQVASAAVLTGAGLALALTGWQGLAAIAGAGLVTVWLGRVAQSRIGGQTGDILGASQQLSFALALSLLL